MKNQRIHSRRDALRLSALGAASFGLAGILSRPGEARPLPQAQFKLLILFLRGGLDGIHALIPHGDTQYNLGLRRTLYVPPSASVPIEAGNTFCMFNPAVLSGGVPLLQPMLQAREIVFLHRVGYPQRSGSHFIDQQAWETGIMPCNPTFGFDPEEGWVPRLQAQRLGAGFHGASVSQGLQQLFQTSNRTRVQPHIRRIRDFPGDSVPFYSLASAKPALDAKYKGQGSSPSNPIGYGLRGTNSQIGSGLDNFNRGASIALLDSEAQIATLPAYVPSTYLGIQAKYPFGHPTQPHPYYPTPNSEGLRPFSAPFFMELRDAVQILQQTTANVVGVELGGFDTHTNQNVELADRLKILAYALRTVYLDSKGSGLAQNLLTMVVTEFGRTSGENITGGTDHGAGTVAIAMGERLRLNNGSMVYNCDPTTWAVGDVLSANDSHYGCNPSPVGPGTFIKHLTDFRAVYAEIMAKRFGATIPDLEAIVPGSSTLPQLNFLA
jgi:uncharacterized protein (DUF1501 family)